MGNAPSAAPRVTDAGRSPTENRHTNCNGKRPCPAFHAVTGECTHRAHGRSLGMGPPATGPAWLHPAGTSVREQMLHNAVTMHVKLARQILVLWISLWLPLAGAMAAAMPLVGKSGQAAGSSPEAAAVHLPQAVLSDLPAAAADSREPMPCHADADQAACDHCELCHIAASLMPATAVRLAGAEAGREHACAGRAAFDSHFPELPQRPPLAPRA